VPDEGKSGKSGNSGKSEDEGETRTQVLAFAVGVIGILIVPVIKLWLSIPPYIGMLFSLGLFWFLADLLQMESPEDEHKGALEAKGIVAGLQKVNYSGVLFFIGVLFAVAALNTAGVLHHWANLMAGTGLSAAVDCSLLGVVSAVVDNVPLLDAVMDMFPSIPVDHSFWKLTALTVGTGGSLLGTGSIAGLTLMGMEGVSFMWYVRNVTFVAFVSFALGILTFEAQLNLLGF
jgi:Na+/H+ antiporter NhaD/arsenite permease-like protein